MELDPTHVTLLVAIGQSVGDANERMAAAWRPSPPDLLAPALSVLERAGMVEQPFGPMGGPRRDWYLTGYGHRFFDFLEAAEETALTDRGSDRAE
jgi:DNA-binding HxlR family transcriptional regulator